MRYLAGRTGKQCRERWHNHLNPGIKKGDWTPEEDHIIITMQQTIGNQWAKVCTSLVYCTVCALNYTILISNVNLHVVFPILDY